VGVHYVGEMAEGSRMRRLMDFVTRGGVKWNKLPSEFERFVYPDFNFSVPDNESVYQQRLIRLFPAEQRAITRYFYDIRNVNRWLETEMTCALAPASVSWLLGLANKSLRKLMLATTSSYLDANFQDAKLKALLVSQWGDYGLPPAESAFGVHAMIANHYFDGAYYPEGSAKSIADAIVPVVQGAGGACLANHEVLEILIENGRAVGVRVKIKSENESQEAVFRAPLIVSDAGIPVTFGRLVPEQHRPHKYLQLSQTGHSCVTLYLGLKEAPSRLGFQGENHWLFDDYNCFDVAASTQELLQGHARQGYLSFPSLKDPQSTKHTAEVVTVADYDAFAKWEHEPWRKRGPEYEALKAKIAEGILSLVEKHYPGFRELVDYAELATPLTVTDMTNHPRGSIYGTPLTPANLRLRGFGPKTPIANLLLTGADAVALGVVGALMSGVAAAGLSLGWPTLRKLLKGEVGAN
jgi:all-trans-retinol 13,14-reductase